MDTGFGARQLYSACRLTLTHHYEPGDTYPEYFGTGFLVEFPAPDNRLGLVTNRHLVDIPWAKPEREGTTLKSIKLQWWQSAKLRLERTIKEPKPLFHDDPSIDVAVIPVVFDPDDPMTFGALYDDIENIDTKPDVDGMTFNHGLSWPHLLMCEKLWPQLEPGEFVTFPGYPVWYDRLQTRPVLRSGVIASDPQTNYRFREGEPTNTDGNHQVLFDAFSTNGNSGSPVFVAQRGTAPVNIMLKASESDTSPRQAGELKFSNYHRSFLIGINAGHFNDLDSKRPNDHAGLSRMHKLSVVMDILRANQSEPDPSARKYRYSSLSPTIYR